MDEEIADGTEPGEPVDLRPRQRTRTEQGRARGTPGRAERTDPDERDIEPGEPLDRRRDLGLAHECRPELRGFHECRGMDPAMGCTEPLGKDPGEVAGVAPRPRLDPDPAAFPVVVVSTASARAGSSSQSTACRMTGLATMIRLSECEANGTM